MKKYILLVIVLLISMLLSPLAALDLNGFDMKNVRARLFSVENTEQSDSSVQIQTADGTNTENSEPTVKVMATASGNIITASERDYLIGCVACEMPPSYDSEALKAQAVAAYTNLVRLKKNPDASLNGADISDSPSRHQGYYSDEQLREKYGDKYEKYYEKIAEAVDAVYGEIITYDGQPIVAAYCAVAPGRTESAEVIWQSEVPYLQSVVSSGDKLAPDYSSTVIYTAEQLKDALSADSGIKPGDNPSEWIGNIELSENKTGVVKSIVIGSKTLSGNEARRLLKLRSPAFSVQYNDGSFIFTVEGYGHAVGMSQYGADYMAKSGSSYKEILKQYYKGVKIEKADKNR